MDEITHLKATIEDLQTRLREEVRLRTEMEKRCHLLEKLAHRDPGTGLRTEAYLRARVHEEIERSIRYPSATTLITLCAPQERVNQLPRLGRRLMEELRASDQIYGLSNTGIAILLVETPEEGAERALERIKADLEQFINGFGYSLTSFPVDTNLADEFLQIAIERHNQVAKQMYPNGEQAGLNSSTFH